MLKFVVALILSLSTFAKDYRVFFCNQEGNRQYLKVDKEECLNMKLAFNIGSSIVYEVKGQLIDFRVSRNKILEANLIEDFRKDYTFRQAFTIKKESREMYPHFYVSPKQNNGVTILIRSPYAVQSFYNLYEIYLKPFIQLGFNVVVQPLRAHYLTSGDHDYYDLDTDLADSRNIIDWIVKQPWSNKKVIGVGHSYDGYTALVTGATNHPAVIGVISTSPVGRDFILREIFHWYKGYVNGGTHQHAEFFRGIYKSVITGVESKDLNLYEEFYLKDSFDEEEINKKEDRLISLLNEAQVPIILAYGVNNDHCSRGTKFIFDNLTTPKYLVATDTAHEITNYTWIPTQLSNFSQKLISRSSFSEQTRTRLFAGNNQIKYQLKNENTEFEFLQRDMIDQDVEMLSLDFEVKEEDYSLALLPKNIYNGFYNIEIEFEEVTDKHILVGSLTPSYVKKNQQVLFEKVSNATYFELTPGKTKYVINGNSILIDASKGDTLLLVNLYKDKNPLDRQLLPKIKSIRLNIPVQKE